MFYISLFRMEMRVTERVNEDITELFGHALVPGYRDHLDCKMLIPSFTVSVVCVQASFSSY